MAAVPPGSTKNLSDSRGEALQAIVSSLAPGGSSSAATPSKEDVSDLSEKLKELLGDADLPQGTARRSERRELLNEEGLPIIEITEPTESVSEPAPGARSVTASIVGAEDAGFMNHVLDMLEEEERIEEERSEARERERRREELEQRKANAKAELERVKSLKETQKKMGKALLKNMADARDKEEKEKAQQEREDLELEEARRSRKPRKCVSWAELPRSARSPARSNGDDTWLVDGAGSSSKPPMRSHVVERFPTRSSGASSPPPVPMGDSDDESNPPSPVPSDSDEEHALSDGSGDEDEPAENHASEDEFDIDSMQHQREIALAYFEKRNTIGVDAARAMSAHSHDVSGEDDWEREDVPLEATLAGPRPKPAQSKFKSEQLAQAYGTCIPSSTPSTSLGPSVLPSSSGALRSVLRTGGLEGNRLIGHSDSEGENEDDARVFIDALRRGEVTNAGAAENSDALIAALESAYGAPPKPPAAAAAAAEPIPTPSLPTGPTAPQKTSKFKLTRAAPPRTPAGDGGPREGSAHPPRPLPTSETVVERRPAPSPTSSAARAPAATPSLSRSTPSMGAVGSPPTIVDSPSFARPGGGAPVVMAIDSPSFAPPGGAATPTPMTTIIDSPSFQPPPPSARQTRLPTVLASSVREASSGAPRAHGHGAQQAPASEPGTKVSRFKAQRAES
ncbi:hypothetical protein BJV78DRAFT_1360116 [Lactifluus subvellereus]|nr:hypothetical protein BJV78DRAFT_1360116 [Lactifluus subvellereus]